MTSKTRILGFLTAALGLFACNQPDKIATPKEASGGTGSVRIEIPSLPADFLAKTSAVSKAVFSLTISGNGMTPIQKSWSFNQGKQDPVTVTGIPAGNVRSFYGRLSASVDTAKKDSSAVYEGWDSAFIERDQTADVELYLRKKGNGSAHVCVEVEGLPADSTCVKPVPPDSGSGNFQGCWSLQINKPGKALKKDSLIKASLKLDQRGGNLVAIVTWNSSKVDSAYGEVYQDGLSASVGGSNIQFKMTLDSGTHVFKGSFTDSSLKILGAPSVGVPGVCDPVTPQPPVVLTSCFDVAQTLLKGKSSKGRLLLTFTGDWFTGVFHWNGFPAAQISSGEAVAGTIRDSAVVNLAISPPKGMVDAGLQNDSLSYKIILPGTNTANGTVFRLLSSKWRSTGTWMATRSECLPKDTLE